MKQPKKITREMKEVLSKNNLNANNWSLLKQTDVTYTFIHKERNTLKVLKRS